MRGDSSLHFLLNAFGIRAPMSLSCTKGAGNTAKNCVQLRFGERSGAKESTFQKETNVTGVGAPWEASSI